MRILFIGDIVGSLGRSVLEDNIKKIKDTYHPQIIIANGENAANGRGLTEKIAKQFFQLGINIITMGNHVWDQKEIYEFIDNYKNIVRPANYPEGTPGHEYSIINFNAEKLAIINLQGRTFMLPSECPFKAADRIINIVSKETSNIIVDFHAETTSEKQAMAWYLDGRVSLVVGTHTHVQTADERILPDGTAYISDAGMVGAYDGILGMKRDSVIEKFITLLPHRFEVESEGRWQFNGIIVDINSSDGKANKIERIRIDSDNILW